jgi:hypothetical protein
LEKGMSERGVFWFEQLMGFAEQSPQSVYDNIVCVGEYLVSRVNARRVRFGTLTTPSLEKLRAQTQKLVRTDMRASLAEVVADARELHQRPECAGALFQAASQFNLLEMTDPSITPEDGVSIYELDWTQGPACAIACGGGTIYRNYFAPVVDGRVSELVDAPRGQTADNQIDCLAALEAELASPELRPWQMRNGYAMAETPQLEQTNRKLSKLDNAQRERLKGLLRVGVQHDVEVVDSGHNVTQVYASGVPVSYCNPLRELWEPLARVILEAAYEATIRVALRCGIRDVYLTLLGGGVFGNDIHWIGDSVLSALSLAGGLDVRIVSFGQPHPGVARIINAFEQGTTHI